MRLLIGSNDDFSITVGYFFFKFFFSGLFFVYTAFSVHELIPKYRLGERIFSTCFSLASMGYCICVVCKNTRFQGVRQIILNYLSFRSVDFVFVSGKANWFLFVCFFFSVLTDLLLNRTIKGLVASRFARR